MPSSYCPPSTAISHWAKVVAASVELIADNLYMPPPPEAIDVSDQLVQGVQTLKHLDSLKNSSSTFDTTDNNPNPNQEVVKRPHSVDVLHNLRNVIIDIFMGYIILQMHALRSQPLTGTEKKKTYRHTRTSARKANNTSQALIQQANTTTEIFRMRDESSQHLETLQTRHNFHPLTFFLIGGVCESFSYTTYKRTTHLEEPFSIPSQAFPTVFPFSRKDFPLTKPPTRHKLAEAITNDFLNHWRKLQTTSPFLIPHSTCR
ncbi:hypothetical protein VP01_596g9 [Puccinia sorghi]|uniref:Uncharacterized protein n=1 Tax=Puccinia sorghi TaxID=27349 RepID=A0A0L6UHJ8_9BASI|nr:hypothetical protein VP01_596g9 [Puccinia sorghi]